ncbi:unnamed protein product, partial [Ectocarpus fasciculatus]
MWARALLLYAAALLLLVTGACGKAGDGPPQEACCAAMLMEGPVPASCGDLVGCPSLGFHPTAADRGTLSPASEAFRQQTVLRESPSCPRSEWEGRCPPSSTMLLANRLGGSCIAAGCVQRESAEST